jgi:Xaa-Pro dipeptidase
MFYDRPSRLPIAGASGHGGVFTRRVLLSGVAGVAGGLALTGCGKRAVSVPPAPHGGAPVLPFAGRPRGDGDDLFGHLVDQSKSVLPIAAEERAARRRKLQGILASLGASAMILEGGATMTYLTGVTWWKSERLFALVVPAEGSHFWICPAFEEGRARSILGAPDGPGGTLVTWHEHAYPYAALDAALR